MVVRAGSRLPASAVLLLLMLSAPCALSQVCENARPTDRGGTQGLGYGSDDTVAHHDSPSGRVRVHYALAGTHAPPQRDELQAGVPDAVVTAAEAGDAALEKFEQLGYREPLSDADSPCSENGGSAAVDVYLLNFAAADGQAPLDHCEGAAPRRCGGFVLVENDFRGGGYTDALEGMRTVVPHELFHLVQSAYTADVERWWAEGSAQWAAKQVYPELRDLERFLPAYFETPWRPLNVPPSGVVSSFLYATAIWPVFLHETQRGPLIRTVFEALADGAEDVFEATDTALSARDLSMAEAFMQFAVYNSATGQRAPSNAGYVDAADYPLVELAPFEGRPGAELSEVLSGFAAYYYSVSVESPLHVEFDADPERVKGMVIPLSDGKAMLDAAMPLPALVSDEALLVVAGQSAARSDAPFTLRLAEPRGSESEVGSAGCSLSNTAPRSPHAPFVLTTLGALLTRRFCRGSRKETRHAG
jgi:hypothetical protein